MPKNNDIQDATAPEEPTVAKTSKTSSNTFLIAGVSAAAAALLAGSAAFALANPASDNFRPHDGKGPETSHMEGTLEDSQEGPRGHGPRHGEEGDVREGNIEKDTEMHNGMPDQDSDRMMQGDMKQSRQGMDEVAGGSDK